MIPVRGFDASDPIPIPPAPSSPQLLFEYPSKPPVVVLYLKSPFVGDEFLWAVVPTGILSDPVPLISAPSSVVVTLILLLWYTRTAPSAKASR